MKGIVLAGGRGTRLGPLTKATSKQLLPVYKNPMIYYPLMTLRDMRVKDVLVITTPEQQDSFKQALSGITELNIDFAVQESPNGIPEAFIIAEEWLNGDDVTLILGDNIIVENDIDFHADLLTNSIFIYKVKTPEKYGVVELDHLKRIKRIVEKPVDYISDYAVSGLYIFENKVCDLAKTLTPSSRGELEIVDLIKLLNEQSGPVMAIDLSGYWFDAGNPDDLLDCANFVRAIEQRTSNAFSLK